MRYMTEGQPVRPANVEQIVAINQGRLPLTTEEPDAPALSPGNAGRRLEENPHLCLIDVREPAEFGAGHAPRAINVQLSSPEFEQRVGWVLSSETPYLLLAGAEEDVCHALHKLAFVGLDLRVEGYVSGGMGAWLAEGLPHDTVPQVSVHQLHENFQGGQGQSWRVVDVREDEEWTGTHIADAHHLNFKSIEGAKSFSFSPEESIALVCATGMRSSTGASLLRRHDFSNVLNVTGGMGAWRAAGYGVVEEVNV